MAEDESSRNFQRLFLVVAIKSFAAGQQMFLFFTKEKKTGPGPFWL